MEFSGHQNGSLNGNINAIIELEVPNGNLEAVSSSDDNARIDASSEEIKEKSVVVVESNSPPVPKEVEVEGKTGASSDHSKQQKGQGESKNKKPHTVASLKVNRDGKVASSAVNGTSAVNPRAKQLAKSSSFSAVLNKPKKSMPTLGTSHPSKLDITSTPIHQEDHMEKTKLKPQNKRETIKADGVKETLSPKATEDKPLRMGTIPAYNFSFKCDERAERRREFYSKLEEKIHAKEMEKTTLQAKSKETQEAEIKMLRKSLTFKATPMPSFYQEPPPPKVELKKIPPTRAKSPKLGRKKVSTTESVEASIQSPQTPRQSLDEKLSRSNPPKATDAVQPKKLTRKSLPKLPSEKTKLSSSAKAVPPSRISQELQNAETPQQSQTDNAAAEDGGETKPTSVQEPVDASHTEARVAQETVAGHAELTLVQEPVLAEQVSVEEPAVLAP